MKTPHIHAELIKAWADGAQIQYKDNENWYDVNNSFGPYWTPTTKYRIKPEPKPDVIKYGKLIPDPEKELTYHIVGCTGKIDRNFDNIMLVFDGETGKLKDAQVLASSGE